MNNLSTLTSEGGEHVPRLKMDERAHEVEAIGGCERDNDITERRIGLNEVTEVLPTVDSMGNRHVDCVSGAPQGNNVAETEQENCGAISHLGTLRAIAERANGDDKENGEV